MGRAQSSLVALLVLAGLSAAAQAAAETTAAWQFSGDLRFGYFNETREPRTGPSSRNDEGRIRLRVAVDGALGEHWETRARLAGRYSTSAAPDRFYLRFDAPTRSGARFGDTTIDELYLQRRARDGSWQIRAGRFHSGVNLLGVAGKALDRKDFPNVGINWTDGVQVELDLADGWRGRFELQYNDRDGIGQGTEAPLDFSRGGSRVGTYTALVGEADGIWAQRMLAVTWFPNALAAQGIAEAARKDYVALDGKLAAAWPLGDAGMRLLLGGEVGFAPNRPDRSVLATGGSGRADGLAWQISANLLDMAPGHNIGVVYARIGAGWLLSPDFRGNDALAEVRYQWRFTPRWSMEARYRIREEIKIPVTAPRERQDTDFYIRLTGRF
ncbi:MAG: hypothetical protein EA417_12850 [Gammaproteobacteria bacterium]|nr:MAG: hypothetical protein EA417_12850 [Gammaproteobacteria bacterium]